MPDPATGVPLAPLTTLRLGGPANRFVSATSEQQLIDAVRACDAAGEPLLVLAGGSNVVIADAGFAGTVVHVATRGVDEQRDGDRVEVEVAAGEPWDPLVTRLVAEGLRGVECLAGIPGSAGATPIQNVGAYGQEVATRIAVVRVLDRATGDVLELAPQDCGFGYRTSIFKHAAGHVALSVRFVLERAPQSDPVRYGELARVLGIKQGERAPLGQVREAVLALRRSKGMVLDAGDHDTWSAGSFFTNPLLESGAFAALRERTAAAGAGEPPAFAQDDGRIKSSAAWLIERAGFERGERRGNAGLSTKHVLALTNRGGATSAELLALAAEIATTVEQRFGVRLEPEPVLVGASLR